MLRITLVLVAACSAAKPTTSPAPTAAPPAASTTTASAFTLAELSFSVRGRDIARMRADGTLEVQRPGQDGFVSRGVVAGDGTMSMGGTPVVTPRSDGAFYASDGTRIFELDRDTLVIDDLRVTVDDTGQLVGMPDDTRVTGANDVATRRTALLVLGLLVEISNEPGRHGVRKRRPATPSP